MIQVTIAALMWCVVAGALLPGVRGGERSVLAAALCIAVSLTLNIDVLYRMTDRALGGANHAELVADLMLMAGVSFLLRGLSRTTGLAASRGERRARGAAAGVAAAAVTVLFLLIRAPHTSTRFMLDYGAEPAAAAYSIVQFTYVGAAMSRLAVICLRHAPEHPHRLERGSFRVLAAGAFGVCLLSADIIGMDIAHVTAHLMTMRAVSALYEPVYVGAAVLLAAGYCLPAVRGAVRSLRDERRSRELAAALLPTWRRTAGSDDALRLTASTARMVRAGGAEGALHRMVVEIRDACLQHGDQLSSVEEQLLDAAERQLLPAPGGASTVDA